MNLVRQYQILLFKIKNYLFLIYAYYENHVSDIYTVEKENRLLLDFKTNKCKDFNSCSNSKKQKSERITLVCEKEMELVEIKINYEIEMCKLKKEQEEFINQITIEKLFLEKRELEEKVKLAKFRAQKKI